jgi:ABC-type multidrug transport system fused ATPase/permease subunit
VFKIAKELKSLLGPRGGRDFLKLIFIAIMSALLQLLGVGSVVPFMAMIGNPSLMHDNKLLNSVYVNLGFASYSRFVVAAGGAMVVAIIVSNAANAFATWYTLHFAAERRIELSDRLIRNYSYKPYRFFLINNTSNLARDVINEVNSLVVGFIEPIARLCVSTFTVGAIAIALLAVDPFAAVVTGGLLGLGYTAIYWFSRKTLTRLGEQRVDADGRRFKVSSELLGGQREARILNCREYFLEKYNKANVMSSRVAVKAGVIHQLPRQGLEVLAFGSIIVLFTYFTVSGKALRTFLPVISFYAVCGIRALPQVQQIFTAFTKIRYARPAVQRLYEEVLTDAPKEPNPEGQLVWSESLKIHNLTFRYDDASPRVVDCLNLAISKDSAVAFVGETGAGKTTLINLLLGLLEPISGSIELDEQVLTNANLLAWQAQIGFVPQDIFLLDDTIRANIAFGLHSEEVDEERLNRAVDLSQLGKLLDVMPKGIETIVGEKGVRLSGGQRQRLGIARALYREPEVLILDEATSALDGTTEMSVMDAIRTLRNQVTMIIIAHRVTTLTECDTIYVLENGRVMDSGTYDQLLKSNEVFKGFAKVGEKPKRRLSS